jgi:hypothetical protein
MRLKIVQTPAHGELDGIDLRRFVVGETYEVGSRVGAVMLAEGWAEPAPDDEPAPLMPFSDDDPFVSRVMDRNNPPNLVRETYPPYADDLAVARDLERRKSRRPRRR